MSKLRITGTFLDEISYDIPHHNWGPEEWDADFAAMKAMGIQKVFLIRCCLHKFMAYPSKVIPAHGGLWHQPPVDWIDLFLTLAEKHGLEFYAGTGVRDDLYPELTEEARLDDAKVQVEIIDEIQSLYGHRKAFAGWYITNEICRNYPGAAEQFVIEASHAKKVTGGKPVMISPFFAGSKARAAASDPTLELFGVDGHVKHWTQIFEAIKGLVDIVAFQDGHAELDELPGFLTTTAELAKKYGVTCWTNVESFDRDMPWRFPPIKWEKMLWKLEQAEAAGMTDALTFEFSHFMSPHSMYPSAAGLYDRYCEYAGLPARARDFR